MDKITQDFSVSHHFQDSLPNTFPFAQMECLGYADDPKGVLLPGPTTGVGGPQQKEEEPHSWNWSS